jgi:superfamily II DNA or RNA helicase
VKQFLITGRKNSGGQFLTGLLPRVLKHAKKRDRKIEVIGRENIVRIRPLSYPELKGITFRPDQREVLKTVRLRQRGRILFPTGTGKTIIALGIMSMFPQCRILFLCHTKDLIEQTREELEKYNFDNYYILGGGHGTDAYNTIQEQDSAVLLSTIQTMSKYTDIFGAFFDLTIVDELHHVNSTDSQYGKLMQANLSPRRYGLGATEPTKPYEVLVNEGIFGPVIAEMTIDKGIREGIIARPIVNLVNVPYNIKLNQKCGSKYADYYEYGIVQNRARNLALLNEVNYDESTLIIIERTNHGEILRKLFKRMHKVKVPFVQGSTTRDIRSKIRGKLKTGKRRIAICSKVWKEGINIPTLNHIIIAHGMKEEKMVLQAAGRGLRTSKGKTEVKITDFLDPYRYLAEHSIQRIQVYRSKGWI